MHSELGLIRHARGQRSRFLDERLARSARAGVRSMPVHGTRHTCRSLLAALDVHPRLAIQIMRHSKTAVTMEIYTRIPSDLERTALHRLGDQIEALK